MNWWPFTRKRKLQTTLPATHPLNYLGVPVDPVVLYLPVYGQVLIIVEAPAPEFLSMQDIYTQDRKLFDLTDADVVPSYYYRKQIELNGFIRNN